MADLVSAGSRRDFLANNGAALAGFGMLGGMLELAKAEKKKKEEVTPTEDLMREHGLLHRLLLIYEDAITRLTRGDASYPIETLASAADINRRFIEDYHERNEELQIFPRFEKAGTMTELVELLRRQHDAGRRVTDFVMANAIAPTLADAEKRKNLADYMQMYIRMYYPHAAREATVLFPALQAVITEKEYDDIGDLFEKKEHELFGEGGFEKTVGQVAGLERKLGLYDLNQFTPPV